MTTPRLRVLAVDDEAPALDELAYLLSHDERVGAVAVAGDAAEAERVLRSQPVDAVFLDIRMPGADGLALARGLAQTDDPPAVVFVTAHEDAAVDAFDLHAVDYLLKPLRADRLAEAVRRVCDRGAPATASGPADEQIPVELAGRTRFVSRSSVRHVEASGDYARLHTAGGSHLVRVPLSVLEQRWAAAGFVRVHRGFLVALHHIEELRTGPAGGLLVRVAGTDLPVSRRHARALRERLLPSRPGGRAARPE